MLSFFVTVGGGSQCAVLPRMRIQTLDQDATPQCVGGIRNMTKMFPCTGGSQEHAHNASPHVVAGSKGKTKVLPTMYRRDSER